MVCLDRDVQHPDFEEPRSQFTQYLVSEHLKLSGAPLKVSLSHIFKNDHDGIDVHFQPIYYKTKSHL